MKKILSLFICTAVFLCACSDEKIAEEVLKETEDTAPVTTIVIETDSAGVTEETGETEESIDLSGMTIVTRDSVGGWETASDYSISDELRELFDSAVDSSGVTDTEPVFYLGSQLVAGTNHCFLCRSTVSVPDVVPYWTLVYIYRDLQGNTEVTKTTVLGYDEETDQDGLIVAGTIPSSAGEWEVPLYPDITPEQQAVIDEMYEHVAFELVDDFVACLGIREDNGYEYCFLSQVSMPGDTEPLGWQLVYIDTDPNGSFVDVRTGVVDIGMMPS